MRSMKARSAPTTPKGIRFPEDLRVAIEAEAKRDKTTFSPKVVELVKLGLKRRGRLASKKAAS
jgi:hypothetical protein